MSTMLAIWRREFRAYFNSPVAYFVITVFLALVGSLFFIPFFTQDRVSMRGFFGLAPFLFVFFAPAITMRLLAEERRTGTLELLITMPVRDVDVILGKYLAALSLLAVALLLLATASAQAEPAFARLYKQQFGYAPSCNACHKDGGGTPLNAYGTQFKDAGIGGGGFQLDGAVGADGSGDDQAQPAGQAAVGEYALGIDLQGGAGGGVKARQIEGYLVPHGDDHGIGRVWNAAADPGGRVAPIAAARPVGMDLRRVCGNQQEAACQRDRDKEAGVPHCGSAPSRYRDRASSCSSSACSMRAASTSRNPPVLYTATDARPCRAGGIAIGMAALSHWP